MKIRLSARGLDITGELERYANRKVTQLAKRVPRKLRPQAECQVHFAQVQRKGVKHNTCTVSFMLDDTRLKGEETTLHMYTALDIAVVHVEHQLLDYTTKLRKQSLRGRVLRRLRADWE